MKCQLCNQEVKEQEMPLNDSIGYLPKFENYEDALKEIIKIASDKRSHIMYFDAMNWERVKIKAIKKIAKNILTQKNK